MRISFDPMHRWYQPGGGSFAVFFNDALCDPGKVVAASEEEGEILAYFPHEVPGFGKFRIFHGSVRIAPVYHKEVSV
jgi:hypothetical protein